jgi:hypothetical protein
MAWERLGIRELVLRGPCVYCSACRHFVRCDVSAVSLCLSSDVLMSGFVSVVLFVLCVSSFVCLSGALCHPRCAWYDCRRGVLDATEQFAANKCDSRLSIAVQRRPHSATCRHVRTKNS